MTREEVKNVLESLKEDALEEGINNATFYNTKKTLFNIFLETNRRFQFGDIIKDVLTGERIKIREMHVGEDFGGLPYIYYTGYQIRDKIGAIYSRDSYKIYDCDAVLEKKGGEE
jgi:hypothetical protein